MHHFISLSLGLLGSNQRATMKEFRQFVETLEKLHLSDDAEFESMDILIDVALKHDQLDSIVCGECVPQKADDDAQDLLVSIHDCVRHDN